jgi:hypothetical protein
MTVTSATNKVSYSGNGSTTVFAYSFKIFDQDDLTVILRSATGTETTQTITTHYTVSGVGSASGGNVTMGTAPASGTTLTILREQPLTQGLDLVANDPFPASSMEDSLDKLTMQVQTLDEEIGRAIKASKTNTITSTEFTVSATDRANKVFSFDGSGELAVTQELGTLKGNWAASTAYVVRDLVKDTSTNNIFMCITAHTSSGSQPLTSNTDSAKWSLIVDAAAAATSATAAATSATAAASSATAAASSASSASTQASNASSSASTASTQATNAASSASAAATSATAAAAALDEFTDVYLGAKSSDPSTDNDGNALTAGDLYFNTSSDTLMVYTGSAWTAAALTASDFISVTGGTISGANKLQFRDTGLFINSSADGQLDVDADTELEITAPTVDINASTAVLVSNDLKLDSDAAVLGFGADNDVTLTHVADTGLLLNSTMALQFNDASQSINAPSATVLDINATDEIELNATAVDLNGTLTVSGDTTLEDGADLITASAGTSNFRAGVNAGNSIQSGGNYNTVVGDEAGTAITTGDYNVAIGYIAGDAINTGERNVIAGHSAGGALTTGGSNTAIGDRALLADTQGSNSVAIGRNALFAQNFSSATNAYNIAIGRDAGASITTGEKNTLIGGQAGDALTDTDANTAVGFNALGSDTLGTKSVAVGESALFSQNFTSATASYNTAVGTDAGVSVTTGTRNTLIGAEAGDAITTGTKQTALGYKALGANTDGVDNVALGDGALTADTRGCRTVAIGRDAFATQNFTSPTDVHSVAVGYAAGQQVTTGDKNTLIGSLAGDSITTGSNNTCVGMGTEPSAVDSGSEIVLGKGTIGMGGSNFTFGKDDGSNRVYNQFSSNATFTRVSDERYKEDIQTNTDCGLDFINDLRTVTFKFKALSDIPDTLPDYDAEATTPEHPDKLYGVIAQEVKAALDTHNITDFGGHHEDPKTGIQGVAQSMFIYPLIKAVQELSAKNAALEARITTLEG